RPKRCLICSSFFHQRLFFHGADFDMNEYEVLGLEQLDFAEFLPQTKPTSESRSTSVTPSVTPQSSPLSTPTPPATPAAQEQSEEGLGNEMHAMSSSPQLRMSKRKAPEVCSLVSVAARLLPDVNLGVVMCSLTD
ncbi:hypothetical protein GOODEAATRI_010703, partial [Goodea atripinnis]